VAGVVGCQSGHLVSFQTEMGFLKPDDLDLCLKATSNGLRRWWRWRRLGIFEYVPTVPHEKIVVQHCITCQHIPRIRKKYEDRSLGIHNGPCVVIAKLDVPCDLLYPSFPAMASLLTLNAVHPDLAYHVSDDPVLKRHRKPLVTNATQDDIEELDEEETERRVEQMNRENADYTEDEERRSTHGSNRGGMDEAFGKENGDSRGSRRRKDDGDTASSHHDFVRTESPDPIEPAPARIPRTVTITEPIQQSIEKTSSSQSPDPSALASTYPSRPRRWTRSLSLARTNTSASYATFSSFMRESWSQRHEPDHKGFWAALWNFVVGGKTEGENGPQEGDPDYIPPKYRWTPILSGLLQPFSILLEIPGLTEHWYVKIMDNKAVDYKPNPVILDVGLAISMASAVVANIALISRFMERRVLASTVTTIIGLSIHDLINIIAITIFGVVHRNNDGFTYSEAFW